MKRSGRSVGPLFPSRVSGSVGAESNETNSVSNSSVIDVLRKVLVEICGLTKEQSMLFSGHSMSVGVQTMWKLGIEDEVHGIVGDWTFWIPQRIIIRYRQTNNSQ